MIRSVHEAWRCTGLLALVLAGAGCAALSDRSGRESAAKVAETLGRYLAAISDHASINAYTHVDAEGAMRRARAIDARQETLPLRGMVIAVKDNIHVAGMPNTAGTASLRHFIPKRSASLVRRLEEAGAVIIGKTGLHELAYGITSANATFGPVRNPVDQTKIPGGSSGGSAAAVRAGLASAAIGTDTGGSVRLPAALTGLVGFRPTTGRYASDGITPISKTRDTIGFIATSVSDVRVLDGVVATATSGTRPMSPLSLSGLRIGVPRAFFYAGLDPDVARIAQDFLDDLTEQGVDLVYADLDDIAALNAKVSFPLALYETGIALPAYLAAYDTGVRVEQLLAGIKSPDVLEVVTAALSGAVTPQQYSQVLTTHRPRLQETYAKYFAGHDVAAIVFPTSPITARDIEGILDGVVVGLERKDTFTTYIRNTDPGSNAGLPGISLPVGASSEGLPVGMEFDGPAASDDMLLAIAEAVERAGLTDRPLRANHSERGDW